MPLQWAFMATNVVIQQTVLRGSTNSNMMQKVALVYVEGVEYRVLAPPGAKGNALDWLPQCSVRKLADINKEEIIDGASKKFVLRTAKETLENQNKQAAQLDGKHPDGIHHIAQICTRGHVQTSMGERLDSKHCSKCGAVYIHECSECGETIRGIEIRYPASYRRPEFCHACGHPYPWMEDRLKTARELLYNDDKLTLDERNALWDLLQYVMSDPKADLVPAKKKLISIKVDKAAKQTREFVLDLLAKLGKEMMTPG